MAQRRMFSLKIVDTDAFLDMPQSSQLLYFQLCMRADDDGFVSNPKKIMRMLGTQDDDYKVLLAKRFVIPFESGVCVIKHWMIHNLIRSDRYIETTYLKEKSQLFVKDNKSYKLKDGSNKEDTDVIPDGNQMEPQVRLGKVRIDNTMLPSEDGIIENLLEDKTGIQHDWQFVGLEIFEKTSAPKEKKSECLRLAKKYPNLVHSALSFCLDYPNPQLKWKMFLWKLNTLIKENAVNLTNTKS